MLIECPQCKSPIAREGQQFCYRCGKDLRSDYLSQGIDVDRPQSKPDTSASKTSQKPSTAEQNEATLSEPSPAPAEPKKPEPSEVAATGDATPRIEPGEPVKSEGTGGRPEPSKESGSALESPIDPLTITSDALTPSEPAGSNATLRILLPTGDVFDRELTRVETQLGKNPRNDLMIADSAVSTTHAIIRSQGGVYTISDLGSKNGTYVNGERIAEPRTLQHGDVIGIGLSKLTFRRSGHSETGAINVTELLETPILPPPLTEDSLAKAVVANGLVAQSVVNRVLANKDRSLYQGLIDERAVGEESLRDMMSRTFQLTVVDLGSAELDEAVAARFPEELARTYVVFPIAIESERLVLAVADPTDTKAIQAIKERLQRAITIRLATRAEITKQIERRWAAKLIGVLPSGEKLEYPVIQKEIEIGKATHNDIVLSDPTVSNTHAVILVRDGGYGIVDLGSRNGTFVNGERLTDTARTLKHGDSIQLGQTVLTFRNPNETDANITATLSAEGLAEVRRRAELENPVDLGEPAEPVPETSAPVQSPASPQLPASQVADVPGGKIAGDAGEIPTVVAEADAAAVAAQEKKKKKKKKEERARIKAAYIRAIATVLGPILSVAATVALTLYLTSSMRNPGSPPSTTPTDSPGSTKAKSKLKAAGLLSGSPFEGGTFEASGVVQVPGTDSVLFVDDSKSSEVLLMSVDQTGRQAGPIQPVLLGGVNIADPEGITFDGSYYYVVGSQSDPKDGDRNALVRFVFDPVTRTVPRQPDVIPAFRDFLLQNVPELSGARALAGDDGGLNIEGIAWDPDQARLLLGLRSPQIGGQAVLVPIRLRDPGGPFEANNLQLAGPGVIKLALGGLGVRDIEYDRRLTSFLLISGAPQQLDKTDFAVWVWGGDAGQSGSEGQLQKEPALLDKDMKPEGLTHFRTSGGSFLLIVGDASRFARIDYEDSQ